MANKKTSELEILSAGEVSDLDRITILDVSDTSGAGSGTGGTLKTIRYKDVGGKGQLIKVEDDIASMLADQANQIEQQLIEVEDASADPNLTFPQGETRLQAYYRYLGDANGSIDDYTLISAPYGNHSDPNRKEIKIISDDTYTLLESDYDKILQFTSATDVTVTVPEG